MAAMPSPMITALPASRPRLLCWRLTMLSAKPATRIATTSEIKVLGMS